MNTRRLIMAGTLFLVGGVALAGASTRRGPAVHTPAEERLIEPASVAGFLASARSGTQRYRSQRAAIEDGFTRVGVEFPAMGEHWVSFARLLEDSLAADRPAVLIYVTTVSGPVLAGVAYTKLVTGDTKPPAFPFDHAWHEHSGAVNEESLPLAHEMHRSGATSPRGALAPDAPRLFILHAWLNVPNPDGDFATDNWTLPLTRLGVTADSTIPRSAAKALALAADNDEYHRFVLDRSLTLLPSEDSLADGVLRGVRHDVASDAAAIRSARRVTARQSKHLAAAWDELWEGLSSALPGRRDGLARLRAGM